MFSSLSWSLHICESSCHQDVHSGATFFLMPPPDATLPDATASDGFKGPPFGTIRTLSGRVAAVAGQRSIVCWSAEVLLFSNLLPLVSRCVAVQQLSDLFIFRWSAGVLLFSNFQISLSSAGQQVCCCAATRELQA